MVESLKSNPKYKLGYDIGYKGQEIPSELLELLGPKEIKRYSLLEIYAKKLYNSVMAVLHKGDKKPLTEENPDVESLKLGIANGVRDLLKTKNTNVYNLLSLIITPVLRSNDGIVGYAKGVSLKDPNIPRETQKGLLSKKPGSLYGMIQQGYMIGVLVAIVRDDVIVLKEGQIPIDTPSYLALMQGLSGENRISEDMTTAFKTLDEQVYRVGREIKHRRDLRKAEDQLAASIDERLLRPIPAELSMPDVPIVPEEAVGVRPEIRA